LWLRRLKVRLGVEPLGLVSVRQQVADFVRALAMVVVAARNQRAMGDICAVEHDRHLLAEFELECLVLLVVMRLPVAFHSMLRWLP